MVNIQPIQPRLSVEVLTPGQVGEIKAATLHILESVGVHFPSEKSLAVFAKRFNKCLTASLLGGSTGTCPLRRAYRYHSWCSNYLEQFHFFDEFASVLGENYVRCCTGESDPEVYSGRVTQFLQDEAELDPNLKYYLCGSAEMVVETRDILISKGIPFDRIVSEIYF